MSDYLDGENIQCKNNWRAVQISNKLTDLFKS